MDSDFEDALRRTLATNSYEQQKQQEALQKAQQHQLLARAIAEPVLRELAPQVAQKLKELGIPTQLSPDGTIRYWDFTPHLFDLSEDGLFMNPYSAEPKYLRGFIVTNSGLDAETEFGLLLAQVHLVNGTEAISYPTGSVGSVSIGAVLPRRCGAVIASSKEEVMIAIADGDSEYRSVRTYPISQFLGCVVASMVSHGNAGQAEGYAVRENLGVEQRKAAEARRRAEEEKQRRQVAKEREQQKQREWEISGPEILNRVEQEWQRAAQERQRAAQEHREQNQVQERTRSKQDRYAALWAQGERDLAMSSKLAEAYLGQIGRSAAKEFLSYNVNPDGTWKPAGLLNALRGRSLGWWRLAKGSPIDVALTDTGIFVDASSFDWSSSAVVPPALDNEEIGVLLDGPEGPWAQNAMHCLLFVDRQNGTVYVATHSGGTAYGIMPYHSEKLAGEIQFVELSAYLHREVLRRSHSQP